MFALVCYGEIVSRHRSIPAVAAADAKLQRQVDAQGNGYAPTDLRVLVKGCKKLPSEAQFAEWDRARKESKKISA